jgi:hypothetical protein
MPGLFLVQTDGSLIELSEDPYESEDALQELLARHPALLSGDSENRRRWLLVTREAPIPDALGSTTRWSLDHLFLDHEGVPTLVEVKRSSDTRIRREVIGQLLDYAANAVAYWPVEAIEEAFSARCRDDGLEPDVELGKIIGPGGDGIGFWQRVKTNLQAGRIRLVFVADVIPPELRRVVEFLNEQMDPAEVLALEVHQFTGPGGVRGLVPRTVGRTEQAQQRKESRAGVRQWDEPSFFAALDERGDQRATAVARKLLHWGQERADEIWWGKGKKAPSFVPVVKVPPNDFYPINVSAGYTTPFVEIGFGHMAVPPFADEAGRRELLGRLRAIPGIDIPEDRVNRYPTVPLVQLAEGERLRQFIDVLDWGTGQVRRAATRQA